MVYNSKAYLSRFWW